MFFHAYSGEEETFLFPDPKEGGIKLISSTNNLQYQKSVEGIVIKLRHPANEGESEEFVGIYDEDEYELLKFYKLVVNTYS